VRESHEQTTNGSVSQTVDVYRGLLPPDGLPNQARRLAIRRESPARLDGVATATPFAIRVTFSVISARASSISSRTSNVTRSEISVIACAML